MTVEIIDTIFTDIFLLAFGILFVIALFKEWGDDNVNRYNFLDRVRYMYCYDNM